MILAIDTTHDHGSLALLADTLVLEEAPLQVTDGYGDILFDQIAALLARHQVAYPQLRAVAAAKGPGTFTGVRIGLTAAKGMAEALGIAAYGVSNLEALTEFATTALPVPFFDARRNEVYARLPNGAEIVTTYDGLLAAIPPHAELITFDFSNYPPRDHRATTAPRAIASKIGVLAAYALAANLPGDPALLDANYVRRSDAELNLRRP